MQKQATVDFDVLINSTPAESWALSGVTHDEGQLHTVLNDLARGSSLNWWARQPIAAESVAGVVQAVNQGRWADLGPLLGDGLLLLRDPRGLAAYEMSAIAAAMRYLMRTGWSAARVAVCATVIEGALGMEVAIDLPGKGRLELVLTGNVQGPMGRFQDIHMDADAGGVLQAWIEKLGLEPLYQERRLSA